MRNTCKCSPEPLFTPSTLLCDVEQKHEAVATAAAYLLFNHNNSSIILLQCIIILLATSYLLY